MGKPRRVTPGVTYLLTRRTYQRTFRLRPHEETNAIALYCLAVAAQKRGVLIHAVVVMSNHLHLVATDPRGLLPKFTRDLHRNIAKAMNVAQHQSENLWSVSRASAARLPTRRDILAKIAYTAANPVIEGLVESPEKWPGVLLWKPGTAVVAERPPVYFSRRNKASPPSATLRIVPPPGVTEDEHEQWLEQVGIAVEERVRKARAEVREKGQKFLGVNRVMSRSFMHRAQSPEVKPSMDPVVAAQDVEVRTRELAVERSFQRAYREARDAWTAGDRSVVFPYGTWWMRVHHRARVADAPE